MDTKQSDNLAQLAPTFLVVALTRANGPTAAELHCEQSGARFRHVVGVRQATRALARGKVDVLVLYANRQLETARKVLSALLSDGGTRDAVVFVAIAPDLCAELPLHINGVPLRPISTPLNRHELVSRASRALQERSQHRKKERGGALMQSMLRQQSVRLAEAERRIEDAQKEQAIVESMLQHGASRDALTGLPNRRALLGCLRECLHRASASGQHQCAVLFLDLDNFKIVNDSLGHDFGDALLIEAAERLLAGVRTREDASRDHLDIVARLGGDEFVVVLDGLHRPPGAITVARRILERMREPYRIRGSEISVTTSIGIAFSKDGNIGAEELLRCADLAMYRAKRGGRARLAVYSNTMHDQVTRRLYLEQSLRLAIEQEELRVHYQPIVDLRTGGITSVEALLRWNDEQYGAISPTEFIEIAEESGLIVPLGRWLFQSTCRDLQAWTHHSANGRNISMNVNVSKRQLTHPGFVQECRNTIAATGVNVSRLNLEVTESTVITGGFQVERQLRQLRELGVHLHMDDFGTGYSSLSCLHRFPVDCVKIDREFVTNMDHKRGCSAVIHAVIALARNLDLKVTAEGVETEGQLAQILTMDCDHAQGFRFGRAVSGDAILHILSGMQPNRALAAADAIVLTA